MNVKVLFKVLSRELGILAYNVFKGHMNTNSNFDSEENLKQMVYALGSNLDRDEFIRGYIEESNNNDEDLTEEEVNNLIEENDIFD